MKTQIRNITVGDRVRKDLGDLETLKKSLEKHGLIHPILINSQGELIAGFRRLSAARELGWHEIEAVVTDPGREIDVLEMEMEENMARKDFTYDELLAGLRRKKDLLTTNPFRRFWNFLKKLFRKIFSSPPDRRRRP